MKLIVIVGLITLQIILFIRGIFEIKRYVFDLCGYLNLLFFVFFTFPSWDLYFDLGLFTHIGGDYSLNASKDFILEYIAITTAVAVLFELGWSLGIRKAYTRMYPNEYIASIRLSRIQQGLSYHIIMIVLFFIWLFVILSEYRAYGGSIISFVLPSRKQGISSGLLGILQYMVPETMFALSMIKHWNYKRVIRTEALSFILVVLSTSIGAQRRTMLQALMFCGLLFFTKFISLKTKKNKEHNRQKKIRWRKYIVIGIGIALILIPLLWYARSFSSQYSRGDKIINPFSLHSFTDLIFGSSSTGFDSTLIVDWYDKTYGGNFLYCIRFFFAFWIPRSIFPNKLSQLTMMIKEAQGAEGNISLFYVNDLYFSFKWLIPIAVPLLGYLISKLYTKFLQSREMTHLVFSLFMFSQIVLLFKNGVSAFLIQITAFYMIFRFCTIFCIQTQLDCNGLNNIEVNI